MSNEELINLETELSHFVGTHRNDLTIETAKKILAIQPANQFAHRALVTGYINSQLDDLAFTSCKSALSYFPEDDYLYMMMYYYGLHKGDYLLSKDSIEKAISINPQNASYYRDLGEVYLINWEHEKAERFLKKAVELDPTNPEFRSRWALSLLRCKRVGESLDVIKKSLREDPDNKDVLDTSGMVYILSGELDAAEELFLEALKRFPTYNYFQKHLDWAKREKADRESRVAQRRSYTPLYLRQTGTKRFFDEDKGSVIRS